MGQARVCGWESGAEEKEKYMVNKIRYRILLGMKLHRKK